MVRKNSIEKLASIFEAVAKKHKDKIHGGLADKKQPKDFDKKQLTKGKKVEMEHVNDRTRAQEISMDHLQEFPDYYDNLAEMEKKMEGKKKGKK
jgi:predicted metal-dependent peptidase